MCADVMYFELSDDEVYSQLSKASKKDFFSWNATSIGNLFVACSGFNGFSVRLEAIRLLEEYLEWCKDLDKMDTCCYKPPWWKTEFPSSSKTLEIDLLQKILDYVNDKEIYYRRDHEALKNYLYNSSVYDKIHDVF